MNFSPTSAQTGHESFRVRSVIWILVMFCATIPRMEPALAAGDGDQRIAGESKEENLISALVTRGESRRIEMIDRVSPSVVCIYDSNRRGGGSGVLIDADGYGLTNYHVVAGMMGKRKGFGGLGDKVTYELEVLGVDVTGDVAMFRLIAANKEHRFPFSRLGDSGAVRLGDTAIAMGNPFMLSEDSTPSVSLGIISGIHRYQEGVRGNLTYTDCIQVDAAINPGNSGGPLFNASGEVIGINGRISVSVRGRMNVGLGYAITSNQIKRFLPALRAGLLAKHGSWKATVEDSQTLDGESLVTFSEVRRGGAAYEAGVRLGDRIVAFEGMAIRSANHVVSLLGTYPQGWPVRLGIAPVGSESNELRDVVVRLDGLDPHMAKPFEVDRDVSLRAVKKLLEAFGRETGSAHDASGWSKLQWKQVRRKLVDPSGEETEPVAEVSFNVLRTRGEPTVMFRRPGEIDGLGAVGNIGYDDRSAFKLIEYGPKPEDVPQEEALVLRALYVARTWILDPLDALDLARASHGGVEWILPKPATLPPGEIASPLCAEIIEWRNTDGSMFRFLFERERSRLTSVSIHGPSGEDLATIKFVEYSSAGKVMQPSVIEVETPTRRYRDTLSDWELTP